MINLSLIGALGAVILAVIGYVYLKIRRIKSHAESLYRANAELTTKNEQLKTEKAVVEKQVKNYKVKQKNDETTHGLGRGSVVDELRKNNDLRSEQ